MLNENVKKLLKENMWDLATCSAGVPNAVPVAFKDVTDDGKLVVTVEDADGAAMSDTLIALHRVPQVLAATLAYEHCGSTDGDSPVSNQPEALKSPCEEAQS